MRYALSRSLFVVGLFIVAGCTGGKQNGFALDGAPIRFQTADLGDPALIAQVNDLKITKEQILDKSQVLKDLDTQTNDFLIGQAYLKFAEKWAMNKGAVTPAPVAETPAEVTPEAKPTATKGARTRGTPSASPSARTAGGTTLKIFLPESESSLKDILIRFDRHPVPGLEIEYAKTEDANLLAEARGIKITRDDIEMQHGLMQSIEQRRYQETMMQLQQQLARVLVNAEAEKQGTNLQDFVNNKILAGKIGETSIAEVEAYLTSIGSSLNDFDEAGKANLQATIKGRKEQRAIEQYVADHLISEPIKTSVKQPHANLKLSEEWAPVLGYGDAPVAVIAFTGSTCPDCPDTLKLLKQIMKEHDGYLKLNVIHNFNSGDGIARLFSEASLCIDGQKRGKSIDFLNQLAEMRGQIDENRFYEWVGANKLNTDEFKKCLVEGRSRELVNQHLAYARGVGILANPTLWIEGQMIEGVVRPNDVEKVLDEKIKQSGATWFSAFVRRLKAIFQG